MLKAINTNYRRQMYEAQISEAATVMLEILHPWDQKLIHKAWLQYAKSGNEFPPNPGQLIALAKEIRHEEYESKKRGSDLLPEPKGEYIPMPDDVRKKIDAIFKPPYEDDSR